MEKPYWYIYRDRRNSPDASKPDRFQGTKREVRARVNSLTNTEWIAYAVREDSVLTGAVVEL